MARLFPFVVLLTVVSLVASCSGADDELVFSFAKDDLCEWITEDDVAEFMAAEYEWAGTATRVESDDYSFEAGPAGCQWALSSTDRPGLVMAGNAELWLDMDGDVFGDLLDGWGVVDYEGGVVEDGSFTGHPALSQGVVVHQVGFTQHAFGVPSEIEWRAIEGNPLTPYERIGHVPPETEWLSVFVDVPGTADDPWEETQARWLAFADHCLQDLGWLPTSE